MSLDQVSSSDPMTELLHRYLADRGGGDPSAASAGDDPQLGLLARMLEQRQAQLEQELERQRAEGELHLAETADAARGELVQMARRRIDELAAEMEPLRARLDLLADALGACAGCWGEDETCRWCRGRGRPGFAPPDPAAFAELIVPVVRAQARLQQLQLDDPGDDRVATQGRRPA